MLVFHLEINREAHSFTLSEVPLVLGLFFASPVHLVVGRMVGEIVVLVFRERQALLKVIFNGSSFLAETAIAIAMFRFVGGGSAVLALASWLAAFSGVIAADLLGMAAVSCVIAWHGGRPPVRNLAIAGVFTMVANTSLALLTTVVVSVAPTAVALLVVLAAIMWGAYRGYASLVQRYASLQLLYDFTRMVTDSVRGEAVIEAMLSQARRLLRAECAEIVLVEEGSTRLRWRIGEDEVLARPGDMPAEVAALLAAVMSLDRPLLIPRSSKNSVTRRQAEVLGVRDGVIAPLRSQQGVFGVIMVADRLGDVSTFDQTEVKLFETLANHAAVALENGRLVDQLRNEAAERRHEALHDPLTALPNRSMFRQRVAETLAARTGSSDALAVMLMDLDRFKEVNDTLGHHNGDLLLRNVGTRLAEVAGAGMTVARLGGDEFAVLLPRVADADDATAVATHIHDVLMEPMALDELSLEVRSSIGIAMWPDHGSDVSTLLKRADIAMYEAKTSQIGVAVYDPEVDVHSPRRLALATELAQAVEAGQLVVYYQPKARLSDRAIIGAEALVRWEHPIHGFIPPDDFIPLAEANGAIRVLTSFVLQTALTDCRRWHDEGWNLSVAVNLAARSLHDPTLAPEVAHLLTDSGLDATRLTLEITESSVMTDMNRSAGVLDDLAAIGVDLSIDDFGTGYSSLAYLKQLPVDELKIDKSFVFALTTHEDDATIVRSVIDLGHNLGLRVVAEGVEHGPVMDRLRDMGCDVAQGYYLSRPVPEPQFREFLTRSASWGRSGRLSSHHHSP